MIVKAGRVIEGSTRWHISTSSVSSVVIQLTMHAAHQPSSREDDWPVHADRCSFKKFSWVAPNTFYIERITLLAMSCGACDDFQKIDHYRFKS